MNLQEFFRFMPVIGHIFIDYSLLGFNSMHLRLLYKHITNCIVTKRANAEGADVDINPSTPAGSSRRPGFARQ